MIFVTWQERCFGEAAENVTHLPVDSQTFFPSNMSILRQNLGEQNILICDPCCPNFQLLALSRQELCIIKICSFYEIFTQPMTKGHNWCLIMLLQQHMRRRAVLVILSCRIIAK